MAIFGSGALTGGIIIGENSCMNILIVEDDVKTAEFVERAFREDGFTTVVARDGEEALSRVRIGDFDVAVVDIMLPKLDGLSLIRAIRKS